MAILTELSITQVQDLRNDANRFDESARKLFSIASSMFQRVEQTSSVWEGKARDAYHKKFTGLRDDMTTLQEIISEYCTDLNTIASTYQSGEDEAGGIADGLTSDYELQRC